MKLQVADIFLEKFQLKPDEVKALRGSRDGSLSKVRQTDRQADGHTVRMTARQAVRQTDTQSE